MAFLNRRAGHESAPRPDLILLDLNLPKKNGFEVLEEIKAHPALRRVPVVILTSSQAERDILRGYDLRANCFVSKPVEVDEFPGCRAFHGPVLVDDRKAAAGRRAGFRLTCGCARAEAHHSARWQLHRPIPGCTSPRWRAISGSAVSETSRRSALRVGFGARMPGRFRYSHLKEAARVCGGRGTMGSESPETKPGTAVTVPSFPRVGSRDAACPGRPLGAIWPFARYSRFTAVVLSGKLCNWLLSPVSRPQFPALTPPPRPSRFRTLLGPLRALTPSLRLWISAPHIRTGLIPSRRPPTISTRQHSRRYPPLWPGGMPRLPFTAGCGTAPAALSIPFAFRGIGTPTTSRGSRSPSRRATALCSTRWSWGTHSGERRGHRTLTRPSPYARTTASQALRRFRVTSRD